MSADPQNAVKEPRNIPPYRFARWLDEVGPAKMEYQDYWDSETNEEGKETDVLDGNFARLETYLEEIGSIHDLALCIRALREQFGRRLEGEGIDLAAGNLWAAPHLTALESVRKLYCLEYSQHRLTKQGPALLSHYGVPQDKVELVLGSFYSLRLPDASLDFAFLSAAFHHAERPQELLAEIRRVLKPSGIVIVIGEHRLPVVRAYLKNAAKFVLGRVLPESVQLKRFGKKLQSNGLFPGVHDLFPTEPVMGDHYYTLSEYAKMFADGGFFTKRIRRAGSIYDSYILVKSA